MHMSFRPAPHEVAGGGARGGRRWRVQSAWGLANEVDTGDGGATAGDVGVIEGWWAVMTLASHEGHMRAVLNPAAGRWP